MLLGRGSLQVRLGLSQPTRQTRFHTQSSVTGLTTLGPGNPEPRLSRTQGQSRLNRECRSNVKTAGVNPGDRGDPINRPPSSWITGLRPEARKIELDSDATRLSVLADALTLTVSNATNWMGAKSTSLSAGGAASFCRIRRAKQVPQKA
ncbi:hypothetical protein J6590_072445 [Homalodisca vitripennis]|nr:hypothetical protein J6590_072445 [Homalodisca vitripennis]